MSRNDTVSTISRSVDKDLNSRAELMKRRQKMKEMSFSKQQTIENEENICDNVLRILRKLWATRQTEDIDKEKDPDTYVKITIRELIVYVIFLLILCIITLTMTSPLYYYFTNILTGQFTGGSTEDKPYLTFTSITSMDDVWRYLKGPFLDGLYTDWYIDSNLTEDISKYVLNENRLLGLPRLRQLKVKNNSCTVHEDFKEEIKFCYDSYSEFTEDTEPFGKYYSPDYANETAWHYRSEAELGGSSVQAVLNKYSGGGFIQLLSSDRAETEAIIDDLFQNLWITRGTRVVFIEFTVYNANINLFCQIRLTFEFPASGGVYPTSTFRTSKLIRYVTPVDYFVMICEILFIFFILYYTVEEIIEIKKHGRAYFHVIWNTLDVLIILVAYVCIVFNLFRKFKVEEFLDSLLANEEQYPDFEFLCYWQLQFNNIVAFTVFAAWMKIFKYTSFSKIMTQLTETLGRCARDVMGFGIMFFIIFFAYAQLGYLVFGTQVYDFSTFQYAVYALFRTILGDFDYEAIERAQRVIGPIYFLSYVFFVFFVLLNMFLAIINDTYGEVKADIVKSEIELSNFIKKGYQKLLEKYNLKRDKIVDVQEALKKADLNIDNKIDFDEWRNDLKSKGYTETEIATLFAKYDNDGDKALSQSEQKNMFEDMAEQDEEIKKALKELEKAAQDIDDATPNDDGNYKMTDNVLKTDYNQLSERIDSIEESLEGILNKIDSILINMEVMEKAKQNSSNSKIPLNSSSKSTKTISIADDTDDVTNSYC